MTASTTDECVSLVVTHRLQRVRACFSASLLLCFSVARSYRQHVRGELQPEGQAKAILAPPPVLRER